MIFGSNRTMLNAIDIPMMKGYDCSYGASLALVESARNDFNMFKAMINTDYMEMSICKESSGYVMESEISSLHEAAKEGIFKKIADFFRSLAGKIKSLFNSFIVKINTIFMKDEKFFNKYKDTVLKKDVSNMEVKWQKIKVEREFDSMVNDMEDVFNCVDEVDLYDDDNAKRYNNIVKKAAIITADGVNDSTELYKRFMNQSFEEEKTVKMGDSGMPSMQDVTEFLCNAKDISKRAEHGSNMLMRKVNDCVKTYEKKAQEAKEGEAETANKEYAIAKDAQDIMMVMIKCLNEFYKIKYKQYKSVFVKALSIKESAVYANALAEAEVEEVDSIITNAISKEDISDVCAANKDLGNYTNYELSYDVEDDYSGNNSYTPVSCKDESVSYFGKLFY